MEVGESGRPYPSGRRQGHLDMGNSPSDRVTDACGVVMSYRAHGTALPDNTYGGALEWLPFRTHALSYDKSSYPHLVHTSHRVMRSRPQVAHRQSSNACSIIGRYRRATGTTSAATTRPATPGEHHRRIDRRLSRQHPGPAHRPGSLGGIRRRMGASGARQTDGQPGWTSQLVSGSEDGWTHLNLGSAPCARAEKH